MASDAAPSATTCAELEAAILSSVAYRDMFDFPLTLEEIHRFLHWHRCALTDIAAVLDQTNLCHGRLATDGTYYCLVNREAILRNRHAQTQRAQQTLVCAAKIAQQLAHLPHIRMIAITGSLAAENCYDGSDIDLLCVTTEGRMWQSRALVLVARRLDAATWKRRICPNFFMSTAAMTFEDHSMYIAHELAQMVPIYGHDVYDRMRAENDWATKLLPNASGPPQTADALSATVTEAVKGPFEKLYGLAVGTWFEPFERARKLRRFNAPGFYDSTHSAFTNERTGHNQATGQKIEREWQKRLQAATQGQSMSPSDLPDPVPETMYEAEKV